MTLHLVSLVWVRGAVHLVIDLFGTSWMIDAPVLSAVVRLDLRPLTKNYPSSVFRRLKLLEVFHTLIINRPFTRQHLPPTSPDKDHHKQHPSDQINPAPHSKMRILVLLSLISAALITYRTATHHTTPDHEAPVLLTGSYSLAAGALTNVLCAAGAYLTSAVPVGMECEACVPWSIVASLVAARMHTFAIGGWGAEGRGYAREVPGKGVRWLVGGPERWFETFDAVGEGEGFVRKVKVGDGPGLETEAGAGTETEVEVEVEPERAEL